MSYPYLSDVVRAMTGLDLPLPFATFGLLVAAALLLAAACLKAELKRLYDGKRIGMARRTLSAKNGAVSIVEKPPQDTVGDMTVAVALAGIVGARVFHILENLDTFALAPWSMIFSRSGLSIFGGLIFGTIAGVIFVRRWALPARALMDACAPAMMLGYGVGRIGCQISGDGDWGIAANMALKPDWLPGWLWAQTYTNNIYGEVIAAPGVYPTPVYETALALACFALLWAVRKHPFKAGWLFSVYLLLAGVERLLIEQIRVNPVLHFGPVRATQAEMIAVVLIACGAMGVALLSQRKLLQPIS